MVKGSKSNSKFPEFIPKYLPVLFVCAIIFLGFIKSLILLLLVLLIHNRKEIGKIFFKTVNNSTEQTDEHVDKNNKPITNTLHHKNQQKQGGNIVSNAKSETKLGRLNIDFSQIGNHFHFDKKTLSTVLVVFGLIIIFNLCTFTVDESTTVVVKTLGNMNKVIVSKDNAAVDIQNALKPDFKDLEIVKDKGLFFKIPFLQDINPYTSKLITYESTEELVTTGDKRQYMVKFFAQYKVTHPGLFEVSMGGFSKANATLDNLIYPVIIKKINKLPSEEFLTNKERLYKELEESKEELNEKIALYGIEVDDIEIHRTLLPPANIASTYDKMIKERQAIAQQIRSEGDEEYNKVVAATDREKKDLIGAAIEESERVRGEADAEALKIYSEAFSKDPEFYEFLRTLKTYENSIDSDTTIYLDKNNEILRIFSSGK
ncbi:membrane protease subunit HflC [Anaerosolibacter carboniphilus]|uniref:Membrane protease subunit HflC n=1 Tax=Anaerosolibacter carboniphilus TaxID=1417629 RepID=A0A841KZV3_9FIRM|nr:protease modulator HflC [Anaerosolibacter carboniphilus]MBB6217858.1 membrane protease subunit HflC [Anaerosolibacter carboniphilus]